MIAVLKILWHIYSRVDAPLLPAGSLFFNLNFVTRMSCMPVQPHICSKYIVTSGVYWQPFGGARARAPICSAKLVRGTHLASLLARLIVSSPGSWVVKLNRGRGAPTTHYTPLLLDLPPPRKLPHIAKPVTTIYCFVLYVCSTSSSNYQKDVAHPHLLSSLTPPLSKKLITRKSINDWWRNRWIY